MNYVRYENVSMNTGRKGNADMHDVEYMKNKAIAWFFDGNAQYYFIIESDEGDSSILEAMRHHNGAAWHIRSNKVFEELVNLDDGDRNYIAVTMVCKFINNIDDNDKSEENDDDKSDNCDDNSNRLDFSDVKQEIASQNAAAQVIKELTYNGIKDFPNPSIAYGTIEDLSDWHNNIGCSGYYEANINGIKCRRVPDYPGLWAGEDGSIWSQLSYNGNGMKARRGEQIDVLNGSPVRKLKPQHCMGYDVISYPKIGRAYGSTHVYVHRLVYSAWISKDIDGRIVTHCDGVLTNNVPDNLFVPVNPFLQPASY